MLVHVINIRDAPDTIFAGYRISGKGRILDVRPDTWLDNNIFGKTSNKCIKTALSIIDFLQTLNKALPI
jgi:hypothetical protein